jgi:hypothetical protein
MKALFYLLLATTIAVNSYGAKKKCTTILQNTAERTGFVLSQEKLNQIYGIVNSHSFLNYGGLSVAEQQLIAHMSPEEKAYLILAYRTRMRGDFLWRLQSQYRLLMQINKPLNLTFAGVPTITKNSWIRAAKEHLEDLDTAFQYVNVNSLAISLAAAKATLTPARLKERVRQIAVKHSTDLEGSDLQGVYPPKVFQFAKQLVRKKIGLDYLPLTDIVANVGDGSKIDFRIISIDPINGRNPNEDALRLHQEVTESMQAPTSGRAGMSQKSKVNWHVNGIKYSADLQMKLGRPLDQIAPAIPSLDYDSMWRDGAVTGLIFSASNMERDANYVLKQYEEYYRENGYRFGRPKQVSDVKKFITNEIKSGSLDYVLREAHAFGADGVVAEVYQSGSMLTGRKRIANGREEVVHIYFPKSTARTRKESFTYEDFRLAMQEREKTWNNPQLLYVDTACFSLRCSAKAISKVGTPKLVAIGAQSSANTFTNEESTALLYLLEGIRKNQRFSEIRDAMRENSENYREGREDDYRFPDDQKWSEQIRSDLSGKFTRAVDYTISIYDENKNPYTIETAERGR